MESEAVYDEALWKSVAELGFTAARVPEAYGGVGLSPEEACVLAEEFGRSLAPVPFMSSLLATEALLLCGSDAQKAAWLPGLADGSVIGCFGWAEGNSATPAAMPDARLGKDGLEGRKVPVADEIGRAHV